MLRVEYEATTFKMLRPIGVYLFIFSHGASETNSPNNNTSNKPCQMWIICSAVCCKIRTEVIQNKIIKKIFNALMNCHLNRAA